MSEKDGDLMLAKVPMGDVDRDTRSLHEKLEDLEEGDSVRIVTKSLDVLARVEEDVRVRKDVDFTERTVEAPVKVYADSPTSHRHTAITWWEPGPVLLGGDGERVERLEVK